MFSDPGTSLLQTIFQHFPDFPVTSRRDQPPLLFPLSPVLASFYRSWPQGLFFLYDTSSNPQRNCCPCFKTPRRSSRLENNTQVLPTTEFLLTSSSFVGRSRVPRFEAQLCLYVANQSCSFRCKEDMDTGKKERITFRQLR